jgi:molybdopterin converting factor small subunit
MMSIRVEFFGIPRQRAGVASTVAAGARLGEVFAGLEGQFPQLAKSCFRNGLLRPGYIANLNGQRFVTDPKTPLNPGDSLLILTADAGG